MGDVVSRWRGQREEMKVGGVREGGKEGKKGREARRVGRRRQSGNEKRWRMQGLWRVDGSEACGE